MIILNTETGKMTTLSNMTAAEFNAMTKSPLSYDAAMKRVAVTVNKATYATNKLKRALHAYDVARRKRARKGNR